VNANGCMRIHCLCHQLPWPLIYTWILYYHIVFKLILEKLKFHKENENYQVNHCWKGCILRNRVSSVGEGMTGIKTQMNINQNFLQTNTKAWKRFKKGFKFSKISFFFAYYALASRKTTFPKVGKNCFCFGHFLLKNATS
jgi:hypothetical protein